MIFISNPNPINLSFYGSLLFNMISKFGLIGGHKFNPSFYNLNICSSFMYLKI